MTDTTLVSKAAELPASIEAHMHRAAVLLAVLQRVDDDGLPVVSSWSSLSRSYETEAPMPALCGDLDNIYGLDKARAAVGAWALALGTTMTEEYEEDYGRRIKLRAAAEVDGVWVRVRLSVGVHDRCPGCGGPAVGSTVLRHFTDAPCSGSLALQA